MLSVLIVPSGVPWNHLNPRSVAASWGAVRKGSAGRMILLGLPATGGIDRGLATN